MPLMITYRRSVTVTLGFLLQRQSATIFLYFLYRRVALLSLITFEVRMGFFKPRHQQIQAEQFSIPDNNWPGCVVRWAEHLQEDEFFVDTSAGRRDIESSDWCVRFPDGTLHVMPDSTFKALFKEE